MSANKIEEAYSAVCGCVFTVVYHLMSIDITWFQHEFFKLVETFVLGVIGGLGGWAAKRFIIARISKIFKQP